MTGKVLVASATLFIFTSWFVAGVQLAADRDERLADGIKEAENLADVLRDHTGLSLQVAAQGVQGIVTTIESEPNVTSDEIHTLLMRRKIATPGFVAISVTDAQGIVRHASTTPTPAAMDVSQAVFFKDVKAADPTEIRISSTLVGEKGTAKGQVTFLVSQRLTG